MRTSKVALSCVIVSIIGSTAIAQDAPRRGGGGGEGRPPAAGQPGQMGQPALPAERAKAAWEAQVVAATSDMRLEADALKTVSAAYAEARTAHNEAVEALRREMRQRASEADGEGRGREAMAEMQERTRKITEEHRVSLRKKLAEILTSGQTDRALESLGTFNAQWDRMVDQLLRFNLDAGPSTRAQGAVKDYVVAVSKIRDSGDRESAREEMQAARTKLSAALREVLSDEQFAEFERAMMPGRRMEGGAAPGDRQAPRRDGGR